MPESRKRAPRAGRPSLPPEVRKRRVQLYLNPQTAAFLEADDLPEGAERTYAARQRKQEAVKLLEGSQGTK